MKQSLRTLAIQAFRWARHGNPEDNETLQEFQDTKRGFAAGQSDYVGIQFPIVTLIESKFTASMFV